MHRLETVRGLSAGAVNTSSRKAGLRVKEGKALAEAVKLTAMVKAAG